MQTARSDVCEMLAAQAYHATSDHVHYYGERELLLLRTPISDVRFRFYYDRPSLSFLQIHGNTLHDGSKR